MEINAGNTAWVLVSSALVMLMTPGLALFYGGMVRRKNILGILMQCFLAMGVLGLQWVIIGYSLSFSSGNAFIGGLEWVGLNGVGQEPNPDYVADVPHLAFMIFQGMFAVITPALIIGAFAERMKFSAFIWFILLWSLFVYYPVCHMVWGVGGLIREMGALDFAGGTVVHINAGIAAFVCAVVLGKRYGYENRSTPLHNIPFTVLGAALLWFGWFGFNAGSALAADGLAAHAFVTTNTAAAAGALSWAFLEWWKAGKPTMFGTVTGVVAGLVAITPAAGFVTVMAAIVFGFTASGVCFLMVSIIKPRFGYDDSLDAFGVHGIGGIWGALLTGVFATTAVNANGAEGLIYGNPELLLIQIKATVITIVYSLGMSFIILKAVDMLVGARVSQEDEIIGLDLTQHHERAYTILE